MANLAYRARTQGDSPFMTTVAADRQVNTLSYRDLDDLSRRLAGWLRSEVGSGTGDVLAMIPLNDTRSVIAIFGALRAGCRVLLLSPTDPVARLREQTEAIGAKVVLCAPGIPTGQYPEAIAVPDATALAEELQAGAGASLTPGDDALYFGTSGSTASAKLVAQSHHNVVANAEAVRRHHGLRRGDRILGCLPVHHVNGLHFTVFGTLAAGAHVVLAHAFHPFGYPRLVERFRPRIASVVPSVLEALLETWREPDLPPEFQYFVSAAAPLTTRTAQDVSRRLGVRVLQGYGLTETTNFSTTVPTDISPDAYRRLVTAAEIPSVGIAMYGNEVAVLRRDGGRAAPGEIGELCMRGHNVMTRYAGNAEATRAAFRHGWFHSQDLGFEVVDLDSGRSFFVITGRSKNIAKIGGETVSLEEMERVIGALPGVLDAVCVCVPHRFLGDEIVAAVVFGAGSRPDLRAYLRTRFAAAVVPRRVVALGTIPRTVTGKILRSQLARTLAAPGGEASGWTTQRQ